MQNDVTIYGFTALRVPEESLPYMSIVLIMVLRQRFNMLIYRESPLSRANIGTYTHDVYWFSNNTKWARGHFWSQTRVASFNQSIRLVYQRCMILSSRSRILHFGFSYDIYLRSVLLYVSSNTFEYSRHSYHCALGMTICYQNITAIDLMLIVILVIIHLLSCMRDFKTLLG